ncbi:hypothetical protein SAMN04490207_0730 [Pseudomonas gessardii]|uniref:Heme utilization protein n=1 Tax=Pseudomonas gessardii TaxID=78544 RepID=A0A7Y1MR22_9PSED|nr:hypothetical protein [Pseudomonas gessardii]MRU49054.1 hypothetical protein [Pseudomonas gessardii]NNA96807.1 hypothetical protein [Pseudomonas gessardii]ONH49431.1 hypothetical protein BLL38_01825 [Pseudomonas gessardii]SDQ50567.1 hypothetical protein SAMN04490207_0730 [Pseudomonas gessardii]
MKPTMALKPLVFALAALMAVAAQADSDKWKPTPKPTGTVAAVVDSTQLSKDNKFDDTKTKNDASVNKSLNGSDGNLGGNVAAGSGNQQANSASIASSAAKDALEVFAVAIADQTSKSNKFTNKGTQNDASANDSVNDSSGNVGVSVTAGQGNQQANSTAIVTADGKNIVAVAATSQESLNNTFLNTASAGKGYGNWGKTYVTNDASLNNSGNKASGNLGINVSAGSGNQQSNSLSLGSGCTQCAAGSGVRF